MGILVRPAVLWALLVERTLDGLIPRLVRLDPLGLGAAFMLVISHGTVSILTLMGLTITPLLGDNPPPHAKPSGQRNQDAASDGGSP